MKPYIIVWIGSPGPDTIVKVGWFWFKAEL